MRSRFEKKSSAGAKLSLRLSSQTLRVLNNDVVCFSSPKVQLNLTQLVSTILVCFSSQANSSVHHCCEIISQDETSPEWKKTQDDLCKKAVALLTRSRRTQTITLNNDIIHFSQGSIAQYESTVLYPWTEEQRQKAKLPSCPDYLYSTFQDYVAALLEEYADLNYREREKIYYKETYENLDSAHAFHLTTFSSPGDRFLFWPRPGNGSERENKDEFLMSDPLLPYNYLVGYSVKENADGSLPSQYKKERAPASFRLSTINDTAVVAGCSDLSQPECDKLEDLIKEYGVAYLFGERFWALVCFSAGGAADFRKRLINRPAGTRMPKIEAFLPGLPAHAEVWMLQDTNWKITRYLRSYGDGVYLFSAQELTPEIYEVLIDAELQKQKRGKKKSGDPAEIKATQRKKIDTQLRKTFLANLKEDTLNWYRSALSRMDHWDAWTEGR